MKKSILYPAFCALLLWVGEGSLILARYVEIKINSDPTTYLQNEEQIVVSPTNPNNLAAVWRDFRKSYRQVGYSMSSDGGKTWMDDSLFSGSGYPLDSDPGITVDANGNFWAVILGFVSTSQPNGLFVYKSTDGGRTWIGPYTVVNQVPGVFEDKELIGCDRTSSPYRGNLYVVWTRFYATDIMISRSTNQGLNWSSPLRISDVSGNQWAVPVIGPNGEVYVAWVSSSIRLDKSTNGGVTFGADRLVQRVVSQSRTINGNVLTFSFPAMDCDITSGPRRGYLYCAFMDSGTDGFGDIFFTRSTDGGQTWSSRIRINDDAVGNRRDQFHPWLTVDQFGNITVVFYDRRNDPANLLMDVYLTQSTDGGISWTPNERVTSVSSDPRLGPKLLDPPSIENWDPSMPIAGKPAGQIGEYIGVAASSLQNVNPIWTDTRNGNQDCYTAYREAVGVENQFEGLQVEKFDSFKIYPNPATSIVNLRFQISDSRLESFNLKSSNLSIFQSSISIKIYDVQGRLIRQIPLTLKTDTEVNWDLRDDLGKKVSAGVYFVRAEERKGGRAEGKTQTRRLVIIR